MTERIAVFKSTASLFAASARVIILRRFGAGCFRSKVLLFDFLLGKRMCVIFITADESDDCTR